MKKTLLYISMFAPYDKIDHASGKICNYYVKKIQKSGLFDLFLIAKCYEPEKKSLDLDVYGINGDIYVLDKNRVHKLLRKFISGFSYFNPFDKYFSILLNYERYHFIKSIKRYAATHAEPKLIILDWTQILLLMPLVKKLFPNSKIVAIEEDVLFLNFERRISLASNIISKKIAYYQYLKLKKRELTYLKQSDVIVTNNPKDTNLLVECGVYPERIFTSTVVMDNYTEVVRENVTKNILYYGSMGRPENYLSVVWLIDHVFPLIEDKEVGLLIVGAHPPKNLLMRQGERIKVVGFVEDVSEYFANSMCLVASLVLGAGIKLKVLEAMSSGLPVLTNHIGIEGIMAEDGKHYFHCEKPEEYARMINLIAKGKIDTEKVGRNARDFIKVNYNMEQKTCKLIGRLRDL